MKSKRMIDIYSLLYLPISRKGHIFSVFADELDISVKTVKRKFPLLRNNTHPNFDVDFWRKHGVICDKDWEYIQSSLDDIKSTIAMLLPEKTSYINKIPEILRFIHPSHLNYAVTIFGFQQSCIHNNYNPPLLKQSCKFILDSMVIFSKIYFSLINNDLDKYNKFVTEFYLPIIFPRDNIWNTYFTTGKIMGKLDNFVQEIVLLLALIFDMTIIVYELTNEDSLGKSALIGAFNTLKKDDDFSFRENFFINIKEYALSNWNLDTKCSDSKFYEKIIESNREKKKFYEKDKIRKLCDRIKNKHPTPEDLDKFFDLLDINNDTKYLLRTQLSHYLMVETIQREYIVKDLSYEALFDRLISYREWLCKKVFYCPIPKQ